MSREPFFLQKKKSSIQKTAVLFLVQFQLHANRVRVRVHRVFFNL